MNEPAINPDDINALRKEISALRRSLGELKIEHNAPRWVRYKAAEKETGISHKTFYAAKNRGEHPELFGNFDGVAYVDMTAYWKLVEATRKANIAEAKKRKKLLQTEKLASSAGVV